jgi:hypothetical protein
MIHLESEFKLLPDFFIEQASARTRLFHVPFEFISLIGFSQID